MWQNYGRSRLRATIADNGPCQTVEGRFPSGKFRPTKDTGISSRSFQKRADVSTFADDPKMDLFRIIDEHAVDRRCLDKKI
tara:strand:+ start:4051 stop:4293 length:243 start_codon:yes stop_codon:yes gene_type:complete